MNQRILPRSKSVGCSVRYLSLHLLLEEDGRLVVVELWRCDGEGVSGGSEGAVGAGAGGGETRVGGRPRAETPTPRRRRRDGGSIRELRCPRASVQALELNLLGQIHIKEEFEAEPDKNQKK